jgi:hypothetical protein
LITCGAIDRPKRSAASWDIGWRPIVADAREPSSRPGRLPSADEIVIAWPEDVLAQVRPTTRRRSSS